MASTTTAAGHQLSWERPQCDHTNAQSAAGRPAAEYILDQLGAELAGIEARVGPAIARALRRWLSGEQRYVGFWTLDAYCVELGIALHELPEHIWRPANPRAEALKEARR